MYSSFATLCHNIDINKYDCTAFFTALVDTYQLDSDCLALTEVTKANCLNPTDPVSANWRYKNFAQSVSGLDDGVIYSYGPSRFWDGEPYGGSECPDKEYHRIVDASNPEGLVTNFYDNGSSIFRSTNTQTWIYTADLNRSSLWGSPLWQQWGNYNYSGGNGFAISRIYARSGYTTNNTPKLRHITSDTANETLSDLDAPISSPHFIIFTSTMSDPVNVSGDWMVPVSCQFWINGVKYFDVSVYYDISNSHGPNFTGWSYTRDNGATNITHYIGDDAEWGTICILERATTEAERDTLLTAWKNNFDPVKP